MKTTKVKCTECGTEFEKRNADYNRTERLGKRHFCNRSCSVSNRNKNWPLNERRKYCYQIKQHAGNRKDEFSPFRYFIIKSRVFSRREKYGSPTIDVEYLKDLWRRQNGICPYTGIKMILPQNTKENMSIHSLKKASLDRIDSTKGYLKGNVHFVCLSINLAKKNFPHEDMIEFIKEIKNAGNVPSVS
jgi:hypothetical protein